MSTEPLGRRLQPISTAPTLSQSDAVPVSAELDTYRQMLMHAAVGIAGIDASGRFHFVNPAFCRLTGLAESALIGRKAPLSHWPAEVLPSVRQAFRGNGGKPVDLVFRPEGRPPTSVSLHVSPIRSGRRRMGSVTVNVDTTERHRLEGYLRRREELFGAVVQIARLGIWTVDMASDTVTWNGQFHTLLGYPTPSLTTSLEANLPGVSPDPSLAHYVYPREQGIALFLARVHPEDRAEVEHELRQRFNRRTREVRLLLPDGSRRVVAIREASENDAGQGLGVVSGVCYDMTEERQQSLALAQDQKMEALNQLSGTLAHDLNNVLGIVIGNLREIDAATTHGEASRSAWGAALEAAVRGAELVSSLLAFARQPIDSNEKRDAPVLCLATYLASLVPMMRFVLGSGIALHTDLPALAATVRIDAARLYSALLNLLTNARDAMAGGGNLRLSLVPARMISGAQARRLALTVGRYVQVKIEDDGKGMPEDILVRASEPYFTTKTAGTGSGLGLAQVDQLARGSGGKLQIASVPERGTHITLYLPAAVPDPVGVQPTPTPTPISPCSLRVLVVDDEPQLGRLVQRVLERRGHRVEVRGTAREARSALRAAAFDILLADIVMPGTMNGVALVNWSTGRFVHLRCALMTGYSPHPALEPAGVPVLRKPFFPDQLVSFVEGLAARGERAPGAGTAPGAARP